MSHPTDRQQGTVRPHDLEIERERPPTGEGIEARVLRVQPIGPVVRVELLQVDTANRLEAELSRERCTELALVTDETVWVRPKQVRLFRATSEPAWT